jgi:hypothetical protein
MGLERWSVPSPVTERAVVADVPMEAEGSHEDQALSPDGIEHQAVAE